MNRAVIGVGSNIEPEKNVARARRHVSRAFRLISASTFEWTDPVGGTDQPRFLNGAFLIETDLGIDALRSGLREIEKTLGRKRDGDRNGPRTIDLDLVLFNGEVVDEDYFRYPFVRRAVDELVRPGAGGRP